MPEIILKNIKKEFGNKFVAVDDLNMVIEDRSFITLLGPSGCGKTTTLRMIAGLETPTKGQIMIDGVTVFDAEKGINLSPDKRDVGFLFQNYALWPHMTVYKNISFGLENMKWPKAKIEERVNELLDMLKIRQFVDRYPSELSGGQQQRVAIARTLAPKPKVLFMDEPLSNLDAKLRGQMRVEISKLHQRLGSTIIYVTHDQTEAMTLGTRIVVMKDGVVQQIDTPQNLYEHPCNKFVAGFIGSPQMNMITADAVEEDGEVSLRFAGQKITLNADRAQALKKGGYVGGKVVLGIRPSDIHGDADSLQKFSKACFDAEVRVYEMLGAEALAYFDIGDASWVASLNASTKVSVGDTIRLAMDTSKIHIFDNVTEKTIAD